MKIELKQINIKNNPRTDFGNLEELSASIKEKGIIEPLVVTKTDDNSYELIAGERRLKAAKMAGLKILPITIYSGSKADIEEVKLIENIHRKNFNPIEEAIAFQNYLDQSKATVDTLSKKIAKTTLYIEKRLQLLTLPKDIQDTVKDNKISMGHGLVIARLKTKSEKRKLLREIINDKLSINHAERQVQYMDSTVSLSDAVFKKSDCKGCQHNGGEQSLLFETGSEIKGLCLNKKCFHKKTLQHVKDESQRLKKAGENVLTEKQLEQVKAKERLNSWDDDYKSVKKRLSKEPETFAVVFMSRYGGKIEKNIYCINPYKRHPKKSVRPGAKSLAGKEEKPVTQDRLKIKVSDYKREFLIQKTQNLMKPSTKKTKAITLFALLTESFDWNDKSKMEAAQKIIEKVNIKDDDCGGQGFSFLKILKLKEALIDELSSSISGLWLKHLYDELPEVSEVFGVDMKSHFKVTEDYLKPYTKDALIDLAKEIGLDKHLKKQGIEQLKKAKRTELIDCFINKGFELKGKIPVIMQKAAC